MFVCMVGGWIGLVGKHHFCHSTANNQPNRQSGGKGGSKQATTEGMVIEENNNV